MKEKILIADDDESILWVLKKFFKEKGFEVLTAKDGAGAEKILKNSLPLISLIDINMPGKGGLKVLEDAKKEPLYAKTPIIIMTAEGTMKNAIEAMKKRAF